MTSSWNVRHNFLGNVNRNRTMKRHFCTLFVFCAFFAVAQGNAEETATRPPNIIFVLADDLGIGDVGCYGQEKIQTPVLDRLAAEGVRFTQGYSGASVCAPSRASLMTGLDMGHCPIRANRELFPEGQKPLPEGTFTVAKLLKQKEYATLCTGKWGMGRPDSSGGPLKSGFDHFYGYNCQKQAHSYYPEYLYEDDRKIELDGKTYAPELTIRYTLDWIRENKDKPFFLFYATPLPHFKYEIDDLGIYKDKDGWNDKQKAYAAMCTRLDTQVGQMLDLLEELKLDDNTIVFFAGDNGSAFDPNWPISKFFNSNAGFRGFKRSHYEGALRQAFLARWPKHIPAATVCDTPIAFWDFLPTCAELSGSEIPQGVPTNGVSLVPLLLRGEKPDRDTFYWELHEGKPTQQALRWKDWKFVRPGPSQAVELYDLANDSGERNDLASKHPELVEKGKELFKSLRRDHPDWPLLDRD